MKAVRRLYDPGAAKPETEWLYFDDAVKELAAALAVSREIAGALLCGLCATDTVRCCGSDEEVIDPHEVPMGIAARPHYVSQRDFREWLRDSCRVATDRDREIKRMLRAGEKPGKRFCDEVRHRCGGWLKKGQPARGFTDRHIRRLMSELRKADI
jgi:hypothetical protein